MKNRKRLILFLFLFLFPFSFRSLKAVETVSTMNMIWQTKKIETDSPFLQSQGTVFFPLMDVVHYFNGEVYPLRKENAYAVLFPNYTLSCVIIPYSYELWINGIRHFFSSRPFYDSTVFYVPFKEFFSLLGFGLTENEGKLTLSPPQSLKYETVTTNSFLSATGYKPRPDALELPYLDEERDAFLSSGKSLYPLKGRFFYKDDILFASLRSFFTSESWKWQEVSSGVWMLEVDKKQYVLSANDRKVMVKAGKSSEERALVHPLVQKNNDLYFPLLSFINAIDYELFWNSKDRVIELLSKITDVQVKDDKGVITIRIFSSHPIVNEAPKRLLLFNGYSIVFPRSVTFLKSDPLRVSKGSIDSISLKHTSSLTGVDIFSRSFLSYPVVTLTSFGCEITFHPYITGIEEQLRERHVSIAIKANEAFTYQIEHVENPSRLIIDIPNSVCVLPQIMRSKSGVFKSIRTSQFKLFPPQTRIVLDLIEQAVSYNVQLSHNTLTVSFPIQRKEKMTVPSSSGALDNALIVLDPGHGGSDPGAVVAKTEFEKVYTLDIAKRLQDKLTQKGALVLLTRENDENPSLRDRVLLANTNNADIFLSIHLNYFFYSGSNGTETYYYKFKDKTLAEYVQEEMALRLKLQNRGIKRARMYVCSHSDMPTALVEPLFMSHPKELALLQKPEFRQAIADALAKGIQRYFEKEER